MCRRPLCSTTCSTCATRLPPLPFSFSLAPTPACLPTYGHHSRLLSSSHLSPDVLHLLDSLPLSLSLTPMWACPLTDRPHDAIMASSLVPSEVSSWFPMCYTHLTRTTTVPALTHPHVGVSTVCSSSVAFLSFHFLRSHWHFQFSAHFFTTASLGASSSGVAQLLLS